jgi:hypothetical protein
MRVVMVTHFTPDSVGGAADRVDGLVAGLAALGHEVVRLLLPIRKTPLSPRWRPYWYIRPTRGWLAQARALHRSADLLIASYLPVADAVVPLMGAGAAPVIYDAHNDEIRLSAVTGRRGAGWIDRMQRRVVEAADVTWMAGTDDTASLRRRHPGATVVDVPNGAVAHPDLSSLSRGRGSCFAYGSWTYGPNQDGLLRLSAARAAVSGTFHVFGRIDDRLRGRLERARPEGAEPTWRFRGFEPDYERMIESVRGPAVIPIWKGGGTKLRAVQLGSMGVPLFGPAELAVGLPAWFRVHANVVEEPSALMTAALEPPADAWDRARDLRVLVHDQLTWTPVVRRALAQTPGLSLR